MSWLKHLIKKVLIKNDEFFVHCIIYSAPEFQSRITPTSTPEKDENIKWPEDINSSGKKIGMLSFSSFLHCRNFMYKSFPVNP